MDLNNHPFARNHLLHIIEPDNKPIIALWMMVGFKPILESSAAAGTT